MRAEPGPNPGWGLSLRCSGSVGPAGSRGGQERIFLPRLWAGGEARRGTAPSYGPGRRRLKGVCSGHLEAGARLPRV